jgi:hypothetical protein
MGSRSEIYLTQNGIEEVVPTPTFEEFAGGSSTDLAPGS